MTQYVVETWYYPFFASLGEPFTPAVMSPNALEKLADGTPTSHDTSFEVVRIEDIDDLGGRTLQELRKCERAKDD